MRTWTLPEEVKLRLFQIPWRNQSIWDQKGCMFTAGRILPTIQPHIAKTPGCLASVCRSSSRLHASSDGALITL